MTTTGRTPDQHQQPQTPTGGRPDDDRSASGVARIQGLRLSGAFVDEAFPPATRRPCWECGTRHESNAMPALCSDACTTAWQERYRIAFGDQPVEVIEATTLAQHDQAVLDAWCADYPSSAPFINALSLDSQRKLAQELRPVTWPGGFARARNRVLELHEAGHLGYLAAADEWIDHHGEPLVPPLQHVADRLARNGELPEFAEWFPAPAEDNRDFPEEPRPADEPQDLVGAEQAAAARLLPLDMPERAELLDVRPLADAPEPAFLARLLNALRRWRP